MAKGIKIGTQYARAAIVANSFNEESGTFDITFATETPVFRAGWDENYHEVLVCKPENVRTARMDVGLNLLDTHPDWSGRVKPADVMGKITNCRFIDNTIVGTVTLGAQCTPETRADIKNGILNTFSVGYSIYRGQREEDAATNKITYRMTDWEPNHVAIAPIPADINSTSRSNQEGTNNFIIDSPKKKIMTIEEIRSKANEDEKQRLNAITQICREAGLSDTKVVELYESESTVEDIRSANQKKNNPTPVDVEGIRSEASLTEKKRLDSILESTRAAKLEDSKAIEYFKSDKTVEEIRQDVIREFAKGDPKVQSAHVGIESGDKKARAVESVMLGRIAPNVFKKEFEDGGEFRGMSLIEIGKELLLDAGVSVRGLSKTDVAQKIFSGVRDMGTSDFPLLLENVSNKLLRAQYAYAEEYWPLISRETSVSDFKTKSLYQIGSSNGMVKIPEGGEIKYGSLTEAKQKISVESFGQGLKFTRQAFINDDLSAFSIIPSKFILDWNTMRGDMVWALITGNVKMDDQKTLFHADHKNLATTAGVVSDAALTAALVALKSQTDIDGKRKIRVQPKFLVVSAEYEMTARKILTVISPTNTGEVNVWSSMGLTLIVEPRLSGKAWYMAADPNSIDGLYHAYLDGNGGLRSNREDKFNTDSIDFGVRGEFGVAAIDYRGWYKNAGE